MGTCSIVMVWVQYSRLLLCSLSRPIPEYQRDYPTNAVDPDIYYGNVVDFSSAQREGFIKAFIRHMEETDGYHEIHKGWGALCSGQDLSKDEEHILLSEAKVRCKQS